jgi:hypothetical protein
MENPGRAVVGAFTGVTRANEWKKGPAAPVQALCGTFTPTASINCSKLTKFKTRLRLLKGRSYNFSIKVLTAGMGWL